MSKFTICNIPKLHLSKSLINSKDSSPAEVFRAVNKVLAFLVHIFAALILENCIEKKLWWKNINFNSLRNAAARPVCAMFLCLHVYFYSLWVRDWLPHTFHAYSMSSMEPLHWLGPFECMLPFSILYEIKLQTRITCMYFSLEKKFSHLSVPKNLKKNYTFRRL